MNEQAEHSGPHVLEAIANVMEAMGEKGVPKSSKNKEQGYAYRGIEAFFAALNPVLVANDLLILPRVLSRTSHERITKSGSTMMFAVVEVEYDIVSAVDDSKVMVRTIGEAQDMADKATNKAMSAAWKYMAMQLFCIPVEGEAEDGDATTPENSSRSGGDDRGRERPEQGQGSQRKPGPTSAQLRAEGAWERYIAEMKAQRTVEELTAWASKVAPTINAWPKKWVDAFKDEYKKVGNALKAKPQDGGGPPVDDDEGPPR